MRSFVALASISCARLALAAAGFWALGCAGPAQPSRDGANPPPPPDPNEIVRARDGGMGPVFQLRDGLAPEAEGTEASEPVAPTDEGADSDDEERPSE